MGKECIMSDVIADVIRDKEHVRVQTVHGTYEGRIEHADCMGVVFVPATDAQFDPAYILYPDIKKVILPDHKRSDECTQYIGID